MAPRIGDKKIHRIFRYNWEVIVPEGGPVLRFRTKVAAEKAADHFGTVARHKRRTVIRYAGA